MIVHSVNTRNNYDGLRLGAALVVLVFHAWPLAGWGHPPQVAGWRVYTLAVFVFFAVSGQLITRSWDRDSRARAYALKRAARILPALVTVVVITAMLLGPLFSTLTPAEYYMSANTWNYLLNILFVAQYPLPGVFETNPSQAVNGSLWSLGPEVLCYGLVALFGPSWLRRYPRARPLATAALAAAFLGASMAVAQVAGLGWLRITLVAMSVFFAASFVEILSPRRSHVLAFALAATLTFGSMVNLPYAELFVVPCLPYIVRYLGEQSTPGIRAVAAKGDFSYGVYLWGFPFTQMAVSMFPSDPVKIMAIAILCTALAAYLSWNIVERPALSHARKLLSRRLGPRERQ